MAAMRIRVRIHEGHFEPLERIDLPEGEEVTVTVDLPESTPSHPRGGVIRVIEGAVLDAPFPLTRRDIYGDL